MKTKWTVLSFIIAVSSLTIAVLGNPPPQNNNNPPPPAKHPAVRPPPHRNHPNVPPGHQPTDYGDPLGNLTPSQLNDFQNGRDEFENVETIESGLGPIFNNNSCVACHSVPSTGGSSTTTVTRFGRTTNGVFDPLASLGGSLLQAFAINPIGQEVVPTQANVVIHRQTTQLYGLGLIEAIPTTTITQGVKKNNPDGVKGRAAMVLDVVSNTTMVGRFGWKAQQATLLAFAADAYVNEMGITNRYFPTENAPNGNTVILAELDTVADPEDTTDPATGKADIDKFTDYMRYLAPPPTVKMTTNAGSGSGIFQQIGCTNCHTPSMTTGSSKIAALNFQKVNLYSDLLLHDMGSLNDGIQQGGANPNEMKTPPLWGVRSSASYLHDGRAATLDDAIRAHDGEAKASRDRYVKLNAVQQSWLQAFLNSL
jgi:CxxC motif-containing protein (DUF1111 family)